MNYDKLIETLRQHGVSCVRSHGRYCSICDEAATALSTLQVENARLRAELEYEREYANAYHEECSQWEAENEKLRAELEQVKRERDAAIEYLREIEWCAGCKNFGGLDGCKKWVIGQCTEKHDLYEFIGPQKED